MSMGLGAQIFVLLAGAAGGQELRTPDDLHQQYYRIFPHGNRNAASHRWSTYVLERSETVTTSAFRSLMGSFCTVSGSPVSQVDTKRWKYSLPMVTGGNMTGYLYHCCWPCVCDAKDFIKVDTKTIKTKDGEQQYHFAVIGNPCEQPEMLQKQFVDVYGRTTNIVSSAPDVGCDGTQLTKATLSDNGYVIIGMFYEPGVPQHTSEGMGFQDGSIVLDDAGYCQARAAENFNSGMGQIFRKVAEITPAKTDHVLTTAPTTTTTTTTPEPPPTTSPLPAESAKAPDAPSSTAATGGSGALEAETKKSSPNSDSDSATTKSSPNSDPDAERDEATTSVASTFGLSIVAVTATAVVLVASACAQ